MGYMYPEKDFGTLSGLAAGQPSREPSSQQQQKQQRLMACPIAT